MYIDESSHDETHPPWRMDLQTDPTEKRQYLLVKLVCLDLVFKDSIWQKKIFLFAQEFELTRFNIIWDLIWTLVKTVS